MMLLGVAQPLNYFRKGDGLGNVSDFDDDTLSHFGIRDNHDKSTFNTSDTIALFAKVFDFDCPLLTLFDWLLWPVFVLRFCFGLLGSIVRR
jgi:hypothetical protein